MTLPSYKISQLLDLLDNGHNLQLLDLLESFFFFENAGELYFIILRRNFRGKEPQYKA
jgi:hypothetical protein